MKSSIVLVTAAFLCLVAFPTTTVGKNLKFWPKPIEGWPHPSDISRNEMFMSTSQKFNYGDSKVWKCTYSNGSAPAISISPSIPSTPYTPSPSTPSTPSPSPPTPKMSPPLPTPSLPPPTPKKSPPPPTPSLPPPTPKKAPSPPPPTPSLPPPTPKKSPSPPKPTPSLPPPIPKKSPSPSPPSDDESSSPSQPSNPHPEHHHSHHQHHENPWVHFGSCMRNMGPVTMCRGQMEFSFYKKMFQVSDYCCNLIVEMKNECDDVIWGFFTDPFFVPLVRCTCHVTY